MKIVFFGVGAVCSVMATLLDELSNKSKQKDINFIFVEPLADSRKQPII